MNKVSERDLSSAELPPLEGDEEAINIEEGDTLSMLAKEHGVDMAALASLNGIQNLDLIHAGYQLYIPTTSGADVPTSSSTSPELPVEPTEGDVSTVNPSSSAVNTDIEVKPGADIDGLRPEITEVFDEIVDVYAQHGAPAPVITSGNDGRHMSGSLHYSDLAIDLRGNNVTDAQGFALARDLQARLGDDYDVIFETFASNPSNDHIHLEFDSA